MKKTIAKTVAAIALVILIGIDLASTLENPARSIAVPLSQLKDDGVSEGYSARVSLVRSDDSALPNPTALTSPLTAEQVFAMVAEAIETSGDLAPQLFAGAKITIKPNVVEPTPEGNGVNTDPRVVEGLIRWLEANGPANMQYTVAEGSGGWVSPFMRTSIYGPVYNGYNITGYEAMRTRLAADGIDIDLRDLNFGTYSDAMAGIRSVPVPEFIDFPEFDAHWIHELVLDPDLVINVPVMKTHTPQITVCLKNHIGIPAGVKYGVWKGRGGPNPGDPKLHKDWPIGNSTEREIIELAAIIQPDFNLVDAVICKERGKFSGDPAVRRNMVLAGADMVAVDTICAQIMGLNPDDCAHLVNAAREGLGTNDPEKIEFVSERALEESLYYFERVPRDAQGGRGHYGMSNRVWLLNAVEGTDVDTPYLNVPDAEVIGASGADGWTEPILFSDDYIDFKAHYTDNGSGYTYYAFCWIDVPVEQDAELFIYHDEGCAVWIGGERVYRDTVYYNSPTLPVEPAGTLHLNAGRQPLLVKLVDERVTAPFALNICRILPSTLPTGKATYTDLRSSTDYARYEGTRVLGLTFDTTEPASDVGEWLRH